MSPAGQQHSWPSWTMLGWVLASTPGNKRLRCASRPICFCDHYGLPCCSSASSSRRGPAHPSHTQSCKRLRCKHTVDNHYTSTPAPIQRSPPLEFRERNRSPIVIVKEEVVDPARLSLLQHACNNGPSGRNNQQDAISSLIPHRWEDALHSEFPITSSRTCSFGATEYVVPVPNLPPRTVRSG
jgi:hypothetical protein